MVAWILPKVWFFDVVSFAKRVMFVVVGVFWIYEILSGSNGAEGVLWLWAKDMDTFLNVLCGILM